MNYNFSRRIGMKKVFRVFVEKKRGNDIEAGQTLEDLKNNVGITALEDLRIINRYDAQGLTEEEFQKAVKTVFSETNLDNVYDEITFPEGWRYFATEYLPGQYDQRADSAAQCIQLLTAGEMPKVASAKVIAVKGDITDAEFDKIKNYIINPVESRVASMDKPESLDIEYDIPADIVRITGFISKSDDEIAEYHKSMGFAMSIEDLCWVRDYFKNEENRDPSLTELKVIDTYWSDHCRHTTFATQLDEIKVDEGKYSAAIEKALNEYFEIRKEVYGDRKDKIVCLMDMACIGTKLLKKQGYVDDLDESEEINACSINVDVEIDGKKEPWLIQFKNETHNHPTEIEPFGGAATCLGGAIRDPLSGRAYVYQAMRVTGAGDPTTPFEDTMEGKLPQSKITTGAAQGYSSYGNQIGLATGQVTELYDEGYVAKRMEIGAVIGASPKKNVKREVPQEGDVIILLGGRTGRDGCGGATGSSKAHNSQSIETCGAEVQKGNPPTERKIQRLFRNAEVAQMIKRCNDFGAGGVSVAIGELADGLKIDLDKVPKKYAGLDGTELAISESQERMAVVIAAADRDAFIKYADEENLEATVVADVTEEPRLVMFWRGDKIVDLSRAFLDTNGVAQHTNIVVSEEKEDNVFEQVPAEVTSAADLEAAWLANLGRLNVCSEKGLSERFDSTIGRGTVMMPFGGKTQLTPSEGMVGRIPVLHGNTTAASVMACGYNPNVACWSPFHGAMYAVTESVVRAVALGADPAKLRLTLQEYFPKLHDANSWGQPFSALLGAFTTLDALDLPAIGGKDSMSGTFMDKTVPPTLVSFAVGVIDGNKAVSADFKAAGDKVIFLSCPRNSAEVLDFAVLKENLTAVHKAMEAGKIAAAAAVKEGGVAALVTTMSLGNELGFEFIKPFHDTDNLFTLQPGGMVLELAAGVEPEELFEGLDYMLLGHTTAEAGITINDTKIDAAKAFAAYREPLLGIFPDGTPKAEEPADIAMPLYKSELTLTAPVNIAKPRVFIPVFPGNNCEYDSARAFEAAGAEANTFIVRNLTAAAIEESVEAMVKYINNSQIVMIPGGFSAGDEPDGSGKFIATMFRNPRIKEAISDLLENRDGLMLGICNGFQALIKLGLVPYGDIRDMTSDAPTLTFNNIGRHISQIVTTRVVSNKSPWFSLCEPGEEHAVAVSHGEGRFYAPESTIKELFANGQVATQYVNAQGVPTMNTPFNPNGSLYAIEGITSPDGRILGKMGHSERFAPGLFRNIAGDKDQKIFLSGVSYFK